MRRILSRTAQFSDDLPKTWAISHPCFLDPLTGEGTLPPAIFTAREVSPRKLKQRGHHETSFDSFCSYRFVFDCECLMAQSNPALGTWKLNVAKSKYVTKLTVNVGVECDTLR